MSDRAERLEPPDSAVVTPDFFQLAAMVGEDCGLRRTNAAFAARFGARRSTCHGAIVRRAERCAVPADVCPVASCLASHDPVHVFEPHAQGPPCARAGAVHVLPVPMHGPQSETACLLVLGPPGQVLDGDAAHLLADTALVLGSDASVLLEGETGTGKERMARAIHAFHPTRAAAPFVAVDCADFRDGVLDSELFGHERGAFTGATAGHAGLIAAAEGGTLFLDEVGDVPPHVQLKLLRLLEARTYRRVGSSDAVPGNFRLICAAHTDLRGRAEDGRLRWDFYYRVATFSLHLPPLREVRSTIPALARSVLAELRAGQAVPLGPDAEQALLELPFPGNFRELRHGLEQALLRAGGGPIARRHLPKEWLDQEPGRRPPLPSRVVSLAEAEQRYLAWACATFRGDRKALAEQLGISERSLYRRLREQGGRSDAAGG
jgi:transcriptional regulator of acetoin/glycerol metabolism